MKLDQVIFVSLLVLCFTLISFGQQAQDQDDFDYSILSFSWDATSQHFKPKNAGKFSNQLSFWHINWVTFEPRIAFYVEGNWLGRLLQLETYEQTPTSADTLFSTQFQLIRAGLNRFLWEVGPVNLGINFELNWAQHTATHSKGSSIAFNKSQIAAQSGGVGWGGGLGAYANILKGLKWQGDIGYRAWFDSKADEFLVGHGYYLDNFLYYDLANNNFLILFAGNQLESSAYIKKYAADTRGRFINIVWRLGAGINLFQLGEWARGDEE